MLIDPIPPEIQLSRTKNPTKFEAYKIIRISQAYLKLNT